MFKYIIWLVYIYIYIYIYIYTYFTLQSSLSKNLKFKILINFEFDLSALCVTQKGKRDVRIQESDRGIFRGRGERLWSGKGR